MYCEKCGKEIEDESGFCPFCGKKFKAKKKPINRKILVTVTAVIVFIALAVTGVVVYIQPSTQYAVGQKAYENANYAWAVKCFERAGDYLDAPQKLRESTIAYKYDSALSLIEQHQYEEAISNLNDVHFYKDAEELLKESHYEFAKECYENDEIARAGTHYAKGNGYKDSYELAMEMAEELRLSNNYSDAGEVYEELNEEKYASYCKGMAFFLDGKYEKAKADLKKSEGVFDSDSKYLEVTYLYGVELFESKKYKDAVTQFSEISEYEDSNTYLNNASIMYAYDEMKDGYLNTAKSILDVVPDDYIYNDIAAADLKNWLNSNSNWVSICGKWEITSGEMKTKQDGSYYDYWWHRDFEEGSYSIQVKCVYNDDGTINIKIFGSIPIYTNYSSLSSLLETSTYNINTNENVSTLGTISIDDLAQIKVSTSQLVLNYKKVDRSQDVYHTYIYTTDATYGIQTEKY